MKPLVSIHQMLTRLCVYPTGDETSISTKFTYVFFAITNITFIVSVLLATGSYAWKYLSIDLQEFLSALIHVFFCSDILYTLAVLYLARQTVKIIFGLLSDIYNTSISHTLFRISHVLFGTKFKHC